MCSDYLCATEDVSWTRMTSSLLMDSIHQKICAYNTVDPVSNLFLTPSLFQKITRTENAFGGTTFCLQFHFQKRMAKNFLFQNVPFNRQCNFIKLPNLHLLILHCCLNEAWQSSVELVVAQLNTVSDSVFVFILDDNKFSKSTKKNIWPNETSHHFISTWMRLSLNGISQKPSTFFKVFANGVKVMYSPTLHHFFLSSLMLLCGAMMFYTRGRRERHRASGPCFVLPRVTHTCGSY
jgi:hypothetical protein